MRLVQLTAGTGTFHCGTCLRDAALVRALRERGHDALLAPLYLPLVLDEEPERARVRMGGINVFLAHGRKPWLPRFVQDWLDASWLLRFAARRGDMTQARMLGEMTVSMLRGEVGDQRPEIEKLLAWLVELRPDVVLLSNALLLGLARPLERALVCPVVCTLQGEAPFLDALPEPHRAEAWRLVAERSRDARAFLAVSAYTAELMRARLALSPEVVHVVPNGIDPREFAPPERRDGPPCIGFVARMCRDKGLDTLVEAFLLLRRRPGFETLRLRAAGAVLRNDRAYVAELERRVADAGFADSVRFRANVTFAEKLEVLRESTVFSVPATYGESFGLYLLEAWAMGLPVVQPEHAAFPELLRATGAGLLCKPDDACSLADALATLIADGPRARLMGEVGRRAVLQQFSAERMALDVERICTIVAPESSASRGSGGSAPASPAVATR